MSKKSEQRYLQTQNPRTKAWIKIDAKSGKIISTKKSPGKYKGIKVVKLARPSAQPTPSRVTPKSKFPVKDLKRKPSPKKKIVKKPKAKLKPAKPKMSEQTKAEVATLNSRIDQLEKNHLHHVEIEIGEVTKEDKDYCKLLRKRMLAKKFPGFF